LKPRIIDNYKSICKSYPKDSELKELYLDSIRWEKWKKRLVSNIKIERKNAKKGYDNQMRTPFERLLPMEKFTTPLQDEAETELVDIIDPAHTQKSARKLMGTLKINDAFKEFEYKGG